MKNKEIKCVGDFPKVEDTTELEFKISKAILSSLKCRKLLTQLQFEQCMAKIESQYRDNNKRRNNL